MTETQQTFAEQLEVVLKSGKGFDHEEAHRKYKIEYSFGDISRIHDDGKNYILKWCEDDSFLLAKLDLQENLIWTITGSDPGQLVSALHMAHPDAAGEMVLGILQEFIYLKNESHNIAKDLKDLAAEVSAYRKVQPQPPVTTQ